VSTVARATERKTISSKKTTVIVAYLFIVPAFVGLLIFRIGPIVFSFVGSLYQVSFAHGGKALFVGVQNYLDAVSDPVFWKSVSVTLIFNALINPIQIGVALAVALLVHRNSAVNNFFRTVYIIPIGVSIVIGSTIWNLLLYPYHGLINSMLSSFGIPPQPFLTSVRQALWSIILISSWCGIPYWMLFLIAGIKEIPAELYEAAIIDGARGFQLLRRITLPLLRRTLLFVIVADTSANFLLFTPILLLTKGGPQMSTHTLMYEVYRSAFIGSDMYRALTFSSILLILLLIIILIQFRLLGESRE